MQERLLLAAASVLIAVSLARFIHSVVYNLTSHPLAKFPGPKIAAASRYWKAFVECVMQKSWHVQLQELRDTYGGYQPKQGDAGEDTDASRAGSVVRVAPNELHFSNPQAYHEIYNNKNRWDKEESLYHSFEEDTSSFGLLTFKDAKARKDILNKSFSTAAIARATGLVQERIDELCKAFAKRQAEEQPANLSFAFKCMTVDIISYYNFGKSVEATHEDDFKAPIIVAMDAAADIAVTFKHSTLFKNMVLQNPPWLARIMSPATAGLLDLQKMISDQIEHILTNREQALALLPHSQTIYHDLTDPALSAMGEAPSPRSLLEEGQSLVFAGTDTVGNGLMIATFHIARDRAISERLKAELVTAMPDPASSPSIAALEKLPYLNACIKEALRVSNGVVSGLPRVVPPSGATIDGNVVPGGAVVSIASIFVHLNEELFPSPHEFRPERWLDNTGLDNWLVAFSRGPRACLGINLAWVELRLALACVWRRFDVKLHESEKRHRLEYRDTFLPHYKGEHVRAWMLPVDG